MPYPKDAPTFWKQATLGGELRKFNLLEHADSERFITGYPMPGDNSVTRKMPKNSIGFEPTAEGLGRVWINDEQYFDKVPESVWHFCIGGYQPAQKWLKDRRGRILRFEDIVHYQKIIAALAATERLMEKIEEIEI